MYFSIAAERLLHQIDVLNHARVHCDHLSRMVTTENVVELIQRRQFVLTLRVAITYS